MTLTRVLPQRSSSSHFRCHVRMLRSTKLLDIFREDLRSQSITGTMEIERGEPRGLVPVPYWAWIDKQARVISALADYQDDRELKFIWPLLKEDLQLCRCYFTAR